MEQSKDSGKLTLIKGSLAYLWEELKTMNRKKVKALSRMLTGYLRMRFREQKPRTKITHS